ncbi:MAG TPA: antibiotic biosynthesis monooxygenase family protein [Opitutaceae bacterium]
MSVTRLNYFTAKPDQVDALARFLTEVIAAVGKAEGCESCRLLRDEHDSKEFVVLETWSSVAAHQKAATIIPKEKIMSVLQLVAAPPRGDYFAVTTG